MTCERIRPLLALLAGNDLDPRETAEARQHLKSCPACQTHLESLEVSTGVLQAVSRRPVMPAGGLWPRLSERLQTRVTVPTESAPGWLTLGAFTAACAALLWLTISTPVFDFNLRDAQFAEVDPGSIPVVRPISTGNPQVQFVNDARPGVPVQIVPEGTNHYSIQTQATPSLFGGPRSL